MGAWTKFWVDLVVKTALGNKALSIAICFRPSKKGLHSH